MTRSWSERAATVARLPESRADYLSAIWRGRPFCVISETMGKEAARAGNSVPRRHVLEGLAATGAAMTRAAAGARTAVSSSAPWDALVLGAGVFGRWTAWTLQPLGPTVPPPTPRGDAHNPPPPT